MDAKVLIYSTPSCHFCQAAKEFFKENNVEYTEHDVASDASSQSSSSTVSPSFDTAVQALTDYMTDPTPAVILTVAS